MRFHSISLPLCLFMVLLGACGPSGYYDARGNFQPDVGGDDRNYYQRNTVAAEKTDHYYTDHSAKRGDSIRVAGYNHVLDRDRGPYHRVGFYDHQGRYIPLADGPAVPSSYMPPRGMCRIWFIETPAPQQPEVRSCLSLQKRVPVSAYLLYGG